MSIARAWECPRWVAQQTYANYTHNNQFGPLGHTHMSDMKLLNATDGQEITACCLIGGRICPDRIEPNRCIYPGGLWWTGTEGPLELCSQLVGMRDTGHGRPVRELFAIGRPRFDECLHWPPFSESNRGACRLATEVVYIWPTLILWTQLLQTHRLSTIWLWDALYLVRQVRRPWS